MFEDFESDAEGCRVSYQTNPFQMDKIVLGNKGTQPTQIATSAQRVLELGYDRKGLGSVGQADVKNIMTLSLGDPFFGP